MSRTKRKKWVPREKRQKFCEAAVAKGQIDPNDPKHKWLLNPPSASESGKSKSLAVRRQDSQRPPVQTSSSNPAATSNVKAPQQQNQRPKIPFEERDNVLLVGEGDFSFTEALVREYRVGKVVSTCFDSGEAVVGKYEGVKGRTGRLGVQVSGDEEKGGDGRNGEEARDGFEGDRTDSDGLENHDDEKKKKKKKKKKEQNSPEDDPMAAGETNPSESRTPPRQRLQTKNITVLYGIDATKLSTTHKKILRPHAPFSKIVFNFPHVGGLSTDVNRQVRSNQQLLVGFFESAKSLLATKENPLKPQQPNQQHHTDDPENYSGSDSDTSSSPSSDQPPPSQILLTLFEGLPYTLWNPRDLARHSGLRVVESFRFPWSAYPGYEHARTIGDVATGKDRSEEGKRKGKWRGEEREARCFVLEVKGVDGADGGEQGGQGRKRKRKTGGESGESD